METAATPPKLDPISAARWGSDERIGVEEVRRQLCAREPGVRCMVGVLHQPVAGEMNATTISATHHGGSGCRERSGPRSGDSRSRRARSSAGSAPWSGTRKVDLEVHSRRSALLVSTCSTTSLGVPPAGPAPVRHLVPVAESRAGAEWPVREPEVERVVDVLLPVLAADQFELVLHPRSRGSSVVTYQRSVSWIRRSGSGSAHPITLMDHHFVGLPTPQEGCLIVLDDRGPMRSRKGSMAALSRGRRSIRRLMANFGGAYAGLG